MITIAKLHSLPPYTRLRKIQRLFHQNALVLTTGQSVDIKYLKDVANILQFETSPLIDQSIRLKALAVIDAPICSCQLGWMCFDISALLQNVLGIDQADWDFADPDSGHLDASRRLMLPFTVIVDRVRSPFNIGSMFRTADSFGVSKILVVRPGADPNHPRAQRTARGCTETVGWEHVEADEALARVKDEPFFALETGGVELKNFQFPDSGTLVIGSEELGVSPELLSRADASLGRVTIPMSGTKGSLNVSVAFGILMHAWFAAHMQHSSR